MGRKHAHMMVHMKVRNILSEAKVIDFVLALIKVSYICCLAKFCINLLHTLKQSAAFQGANGWMLEPCVISSIV